MNKKYNTETETNIINKKKILLKTQETTCIYQEEDSNDNIGLDYEYADSDYQNKNVSNNVLINTKFNMEQCKMNGDKILSKNFYEYNIKPFRTCGLKNGIIGDIKTEDLNYLKLSYDDGYIPICNIDKDSELTRSNMEPKPIDRFAEKITGGRMHILPKNEVQFLNINKFKIGGQNIGNPEKLPIFTNRQGISARDYKRKSSKFYRK